MQTDTIAPWTERIQGIPTAEPFYANDLFVCILLGGFFILATTLASNGDILREVVKKFFLPHESTKTTNTLRLRIGLYVIGFISASLLFTTLLIRRGAIDTTQSMPTLPLVLVAILVVYLLKLGVFKVVNWVFFDKPHNMAWQQSYIDWSILSGGIMYVTCLLAIFFNLSAHALSISLVFFTFLTETLLFFKAFHIFYIKRYGVLKLFVYLCTLELMPLLVVGKALVLFV